MTNLLKNQLRVTYSIIDALEKTLEEYSDPKTRSDLFKELAIYNARQDQIEKDLGLDPTVDNSEFVSFRRPVKKQNESSEIVDESVEGATTAKVYDLAVADPAEEQELLGPTQEEAVEEELKAETVDEEALELELDVDTDVSDEVSEESVAGPEPVEEAEEVVEEITPEELEKALDSEIIIEEIVEEPDEDVLLEVSPQSFNLTEEDNDENDEPNEEVQQDDVSTIEFAAVIPSEESVDDSPSDSAEHSIEDEIDAIFVSSEETKAESEEK